MLKIKNIDKIKGKQITEKWEVYDIDASADGKEYIFTISNVGHYKNIIWYVILDRFKDEVLDRYRIRTNNNGKKYEYLITTISINPTEIIYYMHSIMNNIKKDNDANNT
jgi:hypothetical protein